MHCVLCSVLKLPGTLILRFSLIPHPSGQEILPCRPPSTTHHFLQAASCWYLSQGRSHCAQTPLRPLNVTWGDKGSPEASHPSPFCIPGGLASHPESLLHARWSSLTPSCTPSGPASHPPARPVPSAFCSCQLSPTETSTGPFT